MGALIKMFQESQYGQNMEYWITYYYPYSAILICVVVLALLLDNFLEWIGKKW